MFIITWALAFIAKLLNSLFMSLFSILPSSPFQTFGKFVDDYGILAMMNYFIPFDICAEILSIWVTAMGIYYAVQFVQGVIELKTKNSVLSGIIKMIM